MSFVSFEYVYSLAFCYKRKTELSKIRKGLIKRACKGASQETFVMLSIFYFVRSGGFE